MAAAAVSYLHTCHVSGIDDHRAAVSEALTRLGLDWDAWPGVVTDARLEPAARLSAVLVLLAATDSTASAPEFLVYDTFHASLDWLGRAREPWATLSRMRLPWTPATATTALSTVTGRGPYDDRRVSLALRGARQVCGAGQADAQLLDALGQCVTYLERLEDYEPRGVELLHLARRILASATPPDILDLSLLVDGDEWAGPAREAARSLPADDIAPLVRLLGDLGPRKPSQKWLRDVERALARGAAQRLLRRWTELASTTGVVPEWPGSQIGACAGTLFLGTNTDIVRAAVWATSVLPAEDWPTQPLIQLAQRGEAHNGAPGLPEALALKVASAAVDVLIARSGSGDRVALSELQLALRRRDLRHKITTALAGPSPA